MREIEKHIIAEIRKVLVQEWGEETRQSFDDAIDRIEKIVSKGLAKVKRVK